MRVCMILALMFLSEMALAQDEEPRLTRGQVKELLCRMAVGNIQADVQDQLGLYVQLYADPYAEFPDGRYGLLTGLYYGERGPSHFGPTMDGPIYARYFEDGTQAHDYMAEQLRATTAEFRTEKCEPKPTPQ